MKLYPQNPTLHRLMWCSKSITRVIKEQQAAEAAAPKERRRANPFSDEDGNSRGSLGSLAVAFASARADA